MVIRAVLEANQLEVYYQIELCVALIEIVRERAGTVSPIIFHLHQPAQFQPEAVAVTRYRDSLGRLLRRMNNLCESCRALEACWQLLKAPQCNGFQLGPY